MLLCFVLVGKLSRSQLSQEQVRVYMNEESNRRRNLLHKYIQLCTDANVSAAKSNSSSLISHFLGIHPLRFVFDCVMQVAVDTILIESKQTGKAILDLISVLHITKLVMGTKRPRFSRYYFKNYSHTDKEIFHKDNPNKS